MKPGWSGLTMRGLITEREVFRNLPLIWREFGFRCLVRCVRALFRPEPTTFLEVVANLPPRSRSTLPEKLTDRSALLPFLHERP
jgi:hypothetical protein